MELQLVHLLGKVQRLQILQLPKVILHVGVHHTGVISMLTYNEINAFFAELTMIRSFSLSFPHLYEDHIALYSNEINAFFAELTMIRSFSLSFPHLYEDHIALYSPWKNATSL